MHPNFGSKGARSPGLLCAATSVGPALAAEANHDIHVNSSGDITDTTQLTGWLVHPPGGLTAAVYLSIAVIWLSFAGHQVLSWRRASGERRQQLKWLACGAVVTLFFGPAGQYRRGRGGIVQPAAAACAARGEPAVQPGPL